MLSFKGISFAPISYLPRSGATVDAPTAVIAVSAISPDILHSAAVDVPDASIVVTTVPPEILAGETIDIPEASPITVSVIAPEILAGETIDPPSASIPIAGVAPEILAGETIDVPEATIGIVGVDANIEHSAAVDIPTATISITGVAPDVGGGAYVDVGENVLLEPFTAGGLSFSGISMFSISRGPIYNRATQISPRIVTSGVPPEILAGETIDIPISRINVVGVSPEIGARRRKLRFYSTAS